MAIRIDEQRAVEDNVFLYEEKIKSPAARFIDSTPTFVKYFHINNKDTTVDEGFLDTESILGHKSSLRFNKIDNFPIYGIEQIVLQLQDMEQGLDSSYEGEGLILPSTIKPVPNSYFIIPILKDHYIFRITEIQYDNLMPDNYYKVGFKLEYISETMYKNLLEQTEDEFVCILENIGTENECILEKSTFIRLKDVEKMYHEIVDFYKAMFYDERHNVFLADLDNTGKKLYDPLQTEFINKNGLFKEKNTIDSLILTEEFNDPKRKYKYNKSVYKYIELQDPKLLSIFSYVTRPGTSIHESSFYRWHDKMVQVLDIPTYITNDNYGQIFSQDFVDRITYNAEVEGEYANLIQRFVRKEELTIKDIPLTLDTELIYLNNSLEVFFFTPIIMYIIREIIKKEIGK